LRWLRDSFGSNAMVGEQTPEPGIFLLQMKALSVKRIDFGAVCAIAVHQSMIHHRRIVLPAFATVWSPAREGRHAQHQQI
jgi:hypothetical protein